MSNAIPSTRAHAAVESLEHRTLFVATPGPSFTVVLGHVQEVAASHLRLGEHAEMSGIDISVAKQAVADATKEGKLRLAAEKLALKQAAGDAAAALAAQRALTLGKAETRAEILAAKTELKTVRAEAKETGKALKADLKADSAALKGELKSCGPAVRAAANKLLADWRTMQLGSDVTSADMQATADALRAAADGATQPSRESVATLRANALIALADGDLSDAESDALVLDLREIFLSADIAPPKAEALASSIEVLVDKVTLPPDQMAALIHDVQIVLATFSGE